MAIGKKASPFKLAPLVWAGIAIAGTGLVGGAISAYSGSGKRKDEFGEAQAALQTQLTDFKGLDTSNLYADAVNPYTNMENTYEDLTVNTRQAQFIANQQAQNRANIMQGLGGAAGASGTAALAQVMANQASVDSAKASATIGLQESQNQLAAAKGAGQVQQMERYGTAMQQQMQLQGAADARNLEYQKTQGLLAAATGRMTATSESIENARNRQMQLWGGLMNMGSSAFTAGMSTPGKK